MKFPMMARSVATGLACAFLASCGGDGGSAPTAPATKQLSLSGTAAVGAALAGATVNVKCADGGGTATTAANGSYSLSISGGALPCVIEVTGDSGGVKVTLHSVTEAGATSGNDTTAVANVTPLTELIVAQLTGALPQDLFTSFSSGTQITTAQLTAAKDAVVSALAAATGIDLGAIDPFKAPLVAATSGSTGNTYDQLLDQLGAKVTVEALPVLVAQVATAAASGGAATSETTSLGDIMAGVDMGPMPGCPAVLSGKYRMIDYWGRTRVRQLDFSALKFGVDDVANNNLAFNVVTDSAKPCEFVASGTFNNEQVRFTVAMGPSGGGTYLVENLTLQRSTTGHIFPVQSHALAAFRGEWLTLQSGKFGTDPATNVIVNSVMKLSMADNDTATVCEYPFVDNAECVLEEGQLAVAARADGGINLLESGSSAPAAQFYAYKAPSGAVTLFGTTNAAGLNLSDTVQTNLVAVRQRTLPLPAVNTVTKYAETTMRRTAGNAPANVATYGVDQNTVTAVDTATSTVTRTRQSDGRVDSVMFNHPINGLRYRPDAPNIAAAFQMPLGTGTTVTVNADDIATPFYVVSVQRP